MFQARLKISPFLHDSNPSKHIYGKNMPQKIIIFCFLSHKLQKTYILKNTIQSL